MEHIMVNTDGKSAYVTLAHLVCLLGCFIQNLMQYIVASDFDLAAVRHL